MASRAAARPRKGLALVLMPAELHRLLVQQRYLKDVILGCNTERRLLLQSVYLMQRRIILPPSGEKNRQMHYTVFTNNNNNNNKKIALPPVGWLRFVFVFCFLINKILNPGQNNTFKFIQSTSNNFTTLT